ncbi:ATP-grasp domain-containing protein [Kineosporia succinea]|uniref:ATP-grasp domain-containing protein n=1 Tax=Kineosporia succinea TaxID=84632 RepID=A0ABT9P9A1_9ACTN|nr:ATP-grasp domain-containing protein [Kineosporia succinea]MDP9829263.1 hypothetical protein [Kineosporia succinea]
MILLLPSDPLRPRRPDEHFAPEAAAARQAGFEVALVEHTGDGAVVGRVPAGLAVYRGWMLTAPGYARFAEDLAGRGVALVTSAAQYRQAHELPGWYAALESITPATFWSSDDGRAGFDRARLALGAGPAVLRDWTKSMKHYWHEAAFIPSLEDAGAAWAVAARFRELRDDSFAGGFVLRRFEEFGPAEVRTWWIDGACAVAGPHPDSPEALPEVPFDPAPYASLIGGLGLPFVTVDFALRADGVWRVVELGDGQVSDCPSALRDELVRKLLR